MRVYGHHGIAAQYVASHRDASYPGAKARDQTVGALYIMYTLLGSSGFGAVEWR